MNRRILAWGLVALLTGLCMAASLRIAFQRYHDFRSGYGWDLAYFNQWYWAIFKGNPEITVRPIAAFATEGPSLWKMNFLSPARFLMIPFYNLAPEPRTLLAVNIAVFWMVIPAAYVLARDEAGQTVGGLVGALLVACTPMLWLFALNDFRELQVGMPFLLLSVAGWRGRRVGLSAAGIGGLLACRQEFALVVACLAIIPAREVEGLDASIRWGRAAVVIGLVWFLFLFFGYLFLTSGPSSPRAYLEQFSGPKPSPLEIWHTLWPILAFGLSAWAILALFAPRAGLAAVPWIWSLATGKWTMDWVGTPHGHHVRYVVPALGLAMAAGLIGFGTIWRKGRLAATIATLACLGAFAVAGQWQRDRVGSLPPPIDAEERDRVWHWIGQVGPDDAVMTSYEVAAPLSSRKLLYSYVMEDNKPPEDPRKAVEIRWMFVERSRFNPTFLSQTGFETVHDGKVILIARRVSGRKSGDRGKFTE